MTGTPKSPKVDFPKKLKGCIRAAFIFSSYMCVWSPDLAPRAFTVT